jgi:hypothetical protein
MLWGLRTAADIFHRTALSFPFYNGARIAQPEVPHARSAFFLRRMVETDQTHMTRADRLKMSRTRQINALTTLRRVHERD